MSFRATTRHNAPYSIQSPRHRATRVQPSVVANLKVPNTHARVNLYKMSCWRWSVSQFSTFMSMLRHGCHRHSFVNSQTDSQMYLFIDQQMNWKFVQILMDSKLVYTGHRWRKTEDFFVFCSGKIYLVLFHGFCSCFFLFVCLFHSCYSVSGTQSKWQNSHHSHPLQLFITWIIVNVKCRIDWSYKKTKNAISSCRLKQYSARWKNVRW